jgi:hypothetical protein
MERQEIQQGQGTAQSRTTSKQVAGSATPRGPCCDLPSPTVMHTALFSLHDLMLIHTPRSPAQHFDIDRAVKELLGSDTLSINPSADSVPSAWQPRPSLSESRLVSSDAMKERQPQYEDSDTSVEESSTGWNFSVGKNMSRSYSCPFRKRNPIRFNIRDYPHCAGEHYQDISALK